MITAITPTGDRHLSFALCEIWMARQAVKPDQWIVVDDGRAPTRPLTKMVQYVRREPQRTDPKYTLALNLLAASELALGDKIFIIEDDDYYAPDYIATLATKLESYALAGIGRARYYHLPSGQYFRHDNRGHASLGETAFQKSVLPDLQAAAKIRDEYVDMVLWPAVKAPRLVFFDEDASPLHCSIKAMPGRKGVSHGHDPRTIYYRRGGGGRDSHSRGVLRAWTGGAAELYLALAQGRLNDKNIEAKVIEEIDKWNSSQSTTNSTPA